MLFLAGVVFGVFFVCWVVLFVLSFFAFVFVFWFGVWLVGFGFYGVFLLFLLPVAHSKKITDAC